MKRLLTYCSCALVALSTMAAMPLQAATPQLVWEMATPNSLANGVHGVDWSPSGARVLVGSTDRWVRARQASNGALLYSVLQPQHSNGAEQVIYSVDGQYFAVQNSASGLNFLVHRATDGVFLGALVATIGSNDIVNFAADASLLAAVGGDGTLSSWQFADFTVVRAVGSGYRRVITNFNFSADGLYESVSTQGQIVIRYRNSGAAVRTLNGGLVVTFSPDSTLIGAWAASPNETTLWRVADGAVVRHFADAVPEEGINAIRFTPDGSRLVTTGYLPYVDANGLWQQKGIVRFWRVGTGALQKIYDDHTGIGVTSPVAFSPDASQFIYGTYEGAAVVARTPAL
jgi:WD40 repeat protein